jgi:hypothetical protein
LVKDHPVSAAKREKLLPPLRDCFFDASEFDGQKQFVVLRDQPAMCGVQPDRVKPLKRLTHASPA